MYGCKVLREASVYQYTIYVQHLINCNHKYTGFSKSSKYFLSIISPPHIKGIVIIWCEDFEEFKFEAFHIINSIPNAGRHWLYKSILIWLTCFPEWLLIKLITIILRMALVIKNINDGRRSKCICSITIPLKTDTYLLTHNIKNLWKFVCDLSWKQYYSSVFVNCNQL